MSATTEDMRVSRMTLEAINKVMETLNREKERLAAKIGARPEDPKPDEKPKLRRAAATGVWETLTDAANEKRDRENAPREKAEAARVRAPWEQPYRAPVRRQDYAGQWQPPARQEGRDDRAARMAQELAAEVMALILTTVQRLIHGKPKQEKQPEPDPAPSSSQWSRPTCEPDRSF